MPRGTNRGEWARLEAFKVVDGMSMEFHEIAEVAGVSKQRIFQLYDLALIKFARRAAVARLKEFA